MSTCMHCRQEVPRCHMWDARTCWSCHDSGHQGSPEDCETCYEEMEKPEPSRKYPEDRTWTRRGRQ